MRANPSSHEKIKENTKGGSPMRTIILPNVISKGVTIIFIPLTTPYY